MMFSPFRDATHDLQPHTPRNQCNISEVKRKTNNLCGAALWSNLDQDPYTTYSVTVCGCILCSVWLYFCVVVFCFIEHVYCSWWATSHTELKALLPIEAVESHLREHDEINAGV